MYFGLVAIYGKLWLQHWLLTSHVYEDVANIYAITTIYLNLLEMFPIIQIK